MRGEHAKTRRPRVILSRRVGNAQSPVAARSRQVGKTIFCRGGLKFIYKIQNLRYITMSPADPAALRKGERCEGGRMRRKEGARHILLKPRDKEIFLFESTVTH